MNNQEKLVCIKHKEQGVILRVVKSIAQALVDSKQYVFTTKGAAKHKYNRVSKINKNIAKLNYVRLASTKKQGSYIWAAWKVNGYTGKFKVSY